MKRQIALRGLTLLGLTLLMTGCKKEVALVKGEPPVITGTLESGPWLVEDINGGGIPDNTRVDITFDRSIDSGDAGTSAVTGRSGCNRYRGGWTQTGTTLKLGPLAGTMMACPPAQMETERKFLDTLAAVTSVIWQTDGAAILKAPDGRQLKIRREKA